MRTFNRICVYCGSSYGNRPDYEQAARELGRTLGERGIGVVYGGAKVGLMGVVADTALEHGGEVVGVMPRSMVEREIAHTGISKLHIINSMHERKALMADLSDGFIALPGGYGTYDEFCEMLTWAQLGSHDKPCGLLNMLGYYDSLLAMFDHAVREGFLKPSNRELVIARNQVADLLDAMATYEPHHEAKWIERGER